MTVLNTPRKAGPFTNSTPVPIVGPFAFTFKIFELTDIAVERTISADDTALTEELVYGVDYYVTADLENQDTAPGGTVTLTGNATTQTGSLLKPGYSLTILSNVDYSQLAMLTNYDRFMPGTLNEVHDRAVALIQQIREQIERCLTVSSTSSKTPEEVLAELMAMLSQVTEYVNKAAEYAARAEAAEARAETEWGFAASEAVWTTSTAIPAGTTVTVPDSSFRYLVGHKHFLLFVDGIECFRGIQFNEVGTLDSKSKQFIPTFDIPAGSQIHCWASALGSGSDEIEPRVAALEATLTSLEDKFVCHTTPSFPPLPATGTITQRVTDLETLCTYIEGVAVFRTTPTMPTITGTGTDLARVEVLEAWVPAFESCVTYWTP